MSAALLFASTAAGMAAEPARTPVAVPSGAEVWLQEELSDRVPGMGLVQRYRFVMPTLAELVPPVEPGDFADELPPEMFDDAEGPGDTAQLSPAEQAELDAALGGLSIEGVPDGDPAADGISIQPALPGDGGVIDAPLPSELAAPDATLPGETAGAEESGDLAAIAGDAGDPALPAAPDILMQDPVHRDIVWLCENFALPRLAKQAPRPAQVVISMASAPSPFGSFDPAIVQLFEGFSIPADREACLWEPM
ncbi:DUF6497 family protein [Paracoccus sphaerophysae]|uniref:DUF6497 family protein n=1 Tax=Paracoccus sphaerophysae TaxID=690417 RepID=UPI002356B454|nr:DUF6497 family protein [Paracoccus sphaerophysae]